LPGAVIVGFEMQGRRAADGVAVLVTGPAGAGRTTAIRALEDLGFEAIDNLPLALLPHLFDDAPSRPVAVGIDSRTRGFSAEAALAAIERAGQERGVTLTLLYVDCAPREIIRRFSETRRRHPASPEGDPLTGIEHEVAVLAPLRARAEILIDTTGMTPHDLKAEIGRHFSPAGGGGLAVSLVSFSFKKGLPPGADMVLDLRFLRNPHWEPALRHLDGRDRAVVDHVASDPRWRPFITRLEDMTRFLLDAYRDEGKSYFTLALGCTGGRHRSVAAVEALAETLAADGWWVSIRHRDLVGSATSEAMRPEVGVE
jgi:UPF0042 nucleotide-binding protein